MSLDVLFEDNHCLVLAKPAGLPVQGDASNDPSLFDLAKSWLKQKYQKPGNVYVGLVHRLDRPVSGVLLLAKTSKAAGRLSEQFRAGLVSKTYWAIVECRPANESDTLEDFIVKDNATNRVRIVPAGSEGARRCLLDYRVLASRGGRSLLEVRPRTGRSHQIRVQLASRRHPIVGDLRYGSRVRLPCSDGGSRIALHARVIAFDHPVKRERIEVVAPTPGDWPALAPADG